MKELRIFEWNINQRGGEGRGVIPDFVVDVISQSDADIVVLTEFCTIKFLNGRFQFINKMNDLGYYCYASNNGDGNDILIGVKRCDSIKHKFWGFQKCYGYPSLESFPENLRVDVDCGDCNILSIVGVRIRTVVEYAQRRNEFQWVLDQIENIKNPIIIAGDFNHGRCNSINLDWNISIMKEMLVKEDFTLYTPTGSSISRMQNYNKNRITGRYEEIFFPDDHFATKGVVIEGKVYDREFTSRCPNKGTYRGTDLSNVSPPFPDHAILKGTLIFPTKEE